LQRGKKHGLFDMKDIEWHMQMAKGWPFLLLWLLLLVDCVAAISNYR